jgi:hypothetical protein
VTYIFIYGQNGKRNAFDMQKNHSIDRQELLCVEFPFHRFSDGRRFLCVQAHLNELL